MECIGDDALASVEILATAANDGKDWHACEVEEGPSFACIMTIDGELVTVIQGDSSQAWERAKHIAGVSPKMTLALIARLRAAERDREKLWTALRNLRQISHCDENELKKISEVAARAAVVLSETVPRGEDWGKGP